MGKAGIELGDGDDDRFERIDGARCDRLQGGDDLRADDDGVDRAVRLGGMAAATVMVMVNSSVEAMIGPLRMAKWPTGMPGILCMP